MSAKVSYALRKAGASASGEPSKFAAFRQLLTSPELAFIMEAHNGLSAKIAEEAGFKGIWASGLSISAALGVRDSNEASWTQVLEVLEFMSDATTVPILVDGDTGYGNFNNVRRLVQKLCQRGIAGVCIEDKLFPKTNSFIGEGQPLADIDEFCGKIKAGKDSQLDDDFSMIARVEALISGWGMDEALKRAGAYHEAGADGILIHSKIARADEVLEFKREWADRCPVVIVPTKYHKTPTSEFRDAGIAMVIWANHNMRAAITAMRETSRSIYETESLSAIEGNVASVAEVFDIAGNDELAAAEARYLASAERTTKAVIIAASRGSKLGELTEDKPKSMLDVRGQPLLRRLVHTINDAGVRDVTVVRGYARDAIDLASVQTIDNKDYAETGEVASLACAKARLAGECIFSYGDVLFRRFILEGLLEAGEHPKNSRDVLLAVDSLGAGKNWKKAGRKLDLVSAKHKAKRVFLDEEKPPLVKELGYELEKKKVDGEWMGLAWFSPAGADAARTAMDAMEADGSLAGASMVDLFSRMIGDGVKIGAVYFSGHWLDVDDAFDLARARNLT